MKKLIIKLLLLAVIILGTIYYLDASKYFSYDNDHVEKRWNGLYNFTKTNDVDVLILGNSRTYCGVNPKTLSVRLGANSFVLATPNGNLTQAYYNLREALVLTKPKLVLIETSMLNESNMETKGGEGKSYLYKDFSARRNLWEKMISTPNWFDIEEYPFAWSTSIRNHNFIFNNTDQLKKNYENVKTAKIDSSLFLGRYVRFTSGIKDSILEKYKTDGPAINGKDLIIDPEQLNSFDLLIKLLEENNIKVAFFTVPVYKEHIADYDIRYQKIKELIETKHGFDLYDFQEYYEENDFTPICFENTYGNQHMTYLGSMLLTYKLADSIENSYAFAALPNRKMDQKWHNIFYNQENYFFNNTPLVQAGKVLFVKHDLAVNGCTVKEIAYIDGKKNNILAVKIPKTCLENKTLEDYFFYAVVDINDKGKKQTVAVNIPYTKFHKPKDYHLFMTELKKISITQIRQLTLVDSKTLPANKPKGSEVNKTN